VGNVFAAIVVAVLFPVMWLLKCVAGMVMGLVHTGMWAASSVVRLPVRLVRAAACAVRAWPKNAPVCDFTTSEDASAWWWAEFAADDVMAGVNPSCHLTSSCTIKQQGSKAAKAFVSVCMLPAAVMFVVLFPVIWAVKCVGKLVMGLVCAVAWAFGGAVQLAVGLKRAAACAVLAAWAVLKGTFHAVTWPVVRIAQLAAHVACAAWVVCRGVFLTVAWPVVRALKLAACLACAAWAVLRRVLHALAWPVVRICTLAAFIVRCVFRTLVWTVRPVLKLPVYLGLAIYYAFACVLILVPAAAAAQMLMIALK
jgi:hypothetical protein